MTNYENAAFFICCQTQIGATEEQQGVIAIGIADPGTAKSRVVQSFAKKMKRPMYTLIGSLRDPGDIGGYPEVVEQVTVRDGEEEVVVYMRIVPPKYAVDACDDKWILFFDELTTCPPAVQAAMLRVIAEKVVGDTPLPPDTIMVCAANPPGTAANGFELEAPMANRLYHHKWETPWRSWEIGVTAGGVFPEPQFPKLPSGWRKTIPVLGSLVAAFRKRHPECFELSDEQKQDRSRMSGAWPSARSWWNFAVAGTAAQAACPEDEGLLEQLCIGLVGEEESSQFFEYRDKLDLPDPEHQLRIFIDARKGSYEAGYKHPDRPDKVRAMIGAVSGVIIGNNTKERWYAGVDLVQAASKHDKELALSSAGALFRNIPNGADVPDEVVEDVWRLFGRVIDEENPDPEDD
jgi:hypothetical protein